MNKTTQIIVRMTAEEKTKLESIANDNGLNVSKLIRELITNYIQKKANQD